MSITVDEMLLAKAKLEQELQAVITEKTDLFFQETGVPIANVAVYSERLMLLALLGTLLLVSGAILI
jgi:hypothetical protein